MSWTTASSSTVWPAPNRPRTHERPRRWRPSEPAGSMLLVSGRERIVAGRNSVAISYPAVLAVDANFAAPGVADDLLGPSNRFLLRVRVGARTLSMWLLDVPASIWIRDYVTIFWHAPPLCRSSGASYRSRHSNVRSTLAEFAYSSPSSRDCQRRASSSIQADAARSPSERSPTPVWPA